LLPRLALAHDGVLALRDGRFLSRRHVPVAPLAPAGTLPRSLRQRGVYLITGGFGGIGSLIAEWLAKTARARLVLVGRRALPPRGQWDRWLQEHGANDPQSAAIQRVRRLESMGAEVETVAADVANIVELRAGLQAAQRRFVHIDGVFHAAGKVDDDLIAQKDQARVEEVLAPKVQGALVLAEVLAPAPPDFMVLLSSTSAVLGPAGQVDYVAANSFLDAFARQRSAQGRPTVALQWGVWNGVGMTEAMHRGSAIVGRPQRAGQPLFDELQQIGSDQWLLRAEFGCASHWLLAEHRTAEGHALVPGTGMIEMAAEALRAIGEAKPFELRDLYFFRPLHVPDGEQRPVRCRLRRSIEGFEFTVQSESMLDDGRRGWQTHAQARLLLHDLREPARLDLAQVAAACPEVAVAPPGEALRTGQYAHLRFGKRFFVLRETRLQRTGSGQGLARLCLDDEFAAEAGRFVLHPALLDIATGWAMELVPGYDGRQLWVPLAYHSVRVFGPLGREVASHVRRCRPAGDGIVGFDLCLCAPDGRVLVEVLGLLLKRVTGHGFVMAPVATAAELEFPEAADGIASPAGRLLAETVQNGIRPAEGMEALARVLDGGGAAAGGLPAEITISSLPLAALAARMAAVAAPASGGARFQRPDLDSDYEAPRDDVERTLVQLWEELLGVQKVGVKDDFFELGGHSLIAVRLFAKLRKVFQVDYPISVLFDAPTVEKCGALLKRDRPMAAGAAAAGVAAAAEPRTEAPRARFKHLVAMGQGVPERTPFFLVAGMFGNVLNLRHLAQLLGTDRPFYGLQARGLFGDMAPHATFEEAAVDYLAELRQVQPHGPYLLGGFSGGGITAWEMARQLRAAGEEVAMLVLLDTPLPSRPRLSRADRLKIQVQNLRREGLGYVGRWARSRWRWELGKVRRRLGLERRVEVATSFHNQTIEAAFRASLQRYAVEPQDVRTWLFRPALDACYDLGNGRFASRARELVRPDNGWTTYVPDLRVVEVPGDHDSMVLEPNVRSLARYLREAIAVVEARTVATDTVARDGREISRG
jgi:thioesterase domain-containing protein/NAD(P)-dependent dehydrogenase (short-subunit alcohol dehydrogenase family)